MTANATLPIVMRLENICIDCKKPFAIRLHQHHKKRCDACGKAYKKSYGRIYDLTAKTLCECGRPAVRKFAGDKVCDRCISIDKARIQHEVQRKLNREREYMMEEQERKMWRQTWYQMKGMTA